MFEVEFSSGGAFQVGFSGGSQFEVGFAPMIEGAARPWAGEYESVPKWVEQVYATDGFAMTGDFTVHSIVEQEAPNLAGGLTLSI